MGLDMYAYKCDPRMMKSSIRKKSIHQLPQDLREQEERYVLESFANLPSHTTIDGLGFALRVNNVQNLRSPAQISPNHEFHRWRKHPNLHGWMEKLWRAKGGKGMFNHLQFLRLYPNDLDRLEVAIKQRELPETTGLCFGESHHNEESDANDMLFIANARKAIAEGFAVVYSSWW